MEPSADRRYEVGPIIMGHARLPTRDLTRRQPTSGPGARAPGVPVRQAAPSQTDTPELLEGRQGPSSADLGAADAAAVMVTRPLANSLAAHISPQAGVRVRAQRRPLPVRHRRLGVDFQCPSVLRLDSEVRHSGHESLSPPRNNEVTLLTSF